MRYFFGTVAVYIVFLLSLDGCNVFDPGEVRDNPKDPESEFFVPNKPDGIEVGVEDDQIIIEWKDTSDYEEGYLVEKSIDDTTSFEVIAHLASDTTSFIDKSKIIGRSTFYKISSFIETDGQIKKESSKKVELRIKTITYSVLNYDGEEKISINWSLNPHFSDGIILERKISQDSEFNRVSELNSDRNSFSENISDLKTFRITYKLSSFKRKSDSLFINDSTIRSIDVHSPIMQSVVFNSENETVIEWNKTSNFETGFELEKTSREGGVGDFEPFKKIADLPPNKTTYTDTSLLKPHAYYKYRITAKLNALSSKKSTLNRGSYFYIAEPELTASGTMGKAIKLHWNNPSNRAGGFIIERGLKGNEFSELKRVDQHTSTFEDKTADVGNTYTYRIRTLSSRYSNEQVLKFNSGYKKEVEKTIEGPKYPAIQVLKDINKIGIYSRHVDSGHELYNPVFILDQNSLNIETDFSTTHYHFSSHFSRNGQKYLEFRSNFDLNIYDLSNGELLEQIPNAHKQYSYGTVGVAKFNFDDTLIASFVYSDDGLKIWDAETGNLIQKLNYEITHIRNIEFHPTENLLAVTHISGLDLWDISGNEILYSIPGSNDYGFKGALTFSSSGDILYYASNKEIFVIDNENGTTLDRIETAGTSYQISLTEEKNYLAFGFKHDSTHYIQIIDLASFDTVQVLKVNTYGYPSFVFDQTGENAYSVKRDQNSANLTKWVNENNWYIIKK